MYKKDSKIGTVDGEIFGVPNGNLPNKVEKNPGCLIDTHTKAEKTTLNVKWLLNSMKQDIYICETGNRSDNKEIFRPIVWCISFRFLYVITTYLRTEIICVKFEVLRVGRI